MTSDLGEGTYMDDTSKTTRWGGPEASEGDIERMGEMRGYFGNCKKNGSFPWRRVIRGGKAKIATQ